MRSRVLLLALLATVAGLRSAPALADDPAGLDPALLSREDSAAPVLGLLSHGSLRPTGDLGLLGTTRLPEDPDPDAEADAAWYVRWLRRVGGAPLVPADLFRRAHVEIEVETPDGVSRAAVSAPFGVRSAWSSTRRHAVVSDYDATLACDNSGGLRPSALADPRAATVEDGVAVDVRAFATGEPGAVALEAIVQWGSLARPVDVVSTGARFQGDLDLPRYRGGVALLSGTVREGEALSADVDLEGRPARIRLRPRVVELGEAAGRETVRSLDGGLLTASPWLAERTAASSLAIRRGPPALLPSDLLARVEGAGLDARLDRGGCVWVAGDPAALGAARADVARSVGSRARTVLVEVRALAGDREVGRFSVPALTGRTALLRVGEDRAFLEDADAEVGCFIAISDPRVGVAFDGWWILVRPEVAFGGRAVRVVADLRRQAVAEVQPRRLGDVHGLVHLLRTAERRVAADAVLAGEAPLALPAGTLPDGRALRFELRARIAHAKRTE